jgi:hypothetical protein
MTCEPLGKTLKWESYTPKKMGGQLRTPIFCSGGNPEGVTVPHFDVYNFVDLSFRRSKQLNGAGNNPTIYVIRTPN